MPIARYHRPGPGPGGIYLAHATGFCKEVWNPVVEELERAGWSGSISAWDAPGHGGTGAPRLPFDWWETARAALHVVRDQPDEPPRIGVGHSMGGATLVMAELLEPSTFSSLVLIEPIVFPPPFQRIEEHPLVHGALRRRRSFSSRDEALAHFAAKKPFWSWDGRALRAYVESGLIESGDGFKLACDPEVEADAYRSGSAHGAYDRLGQIRCPVLVLAGERSNTHPAPFAVHLSERFPRGRSRIMPDLGHFAPMERPDLVAADIIEEVHRLNTPDGRL